MNEPQSFKYEPWMQYYFDSHGIPSLRNALATFLTKRFKAPKDIDPENIAVTLGCGAAIDLLLHLITDPGDCILITAPFYKTTENDSFRNEVKFHHVFPSNKDFLVTSKELEEGFSRAKAEGLNVKVVMTINPDNPTGRTRNRESLEDFLNFAHKHDLHAVVNESYALTTFKEDYQFCSVLSIPELPNPEKTHFLWGFSKDFGISGLRCGVIHSKIYYSHFNTLFFMETPPAIVQDTLAKMISDEKWLDEVYFPTNKSRLIRSYDKGCAALRSMGAEPFALYSAGFFIWADFSKILKTCTDEEEWNFYEMCFAQGAYIIPGQIFYCPFPGWFRITFTYEVEQMELGLERIRKAISIYQSS